jgi:hypothetical protein
MCAVVVLVAVFVVWLGHVINSVARSADAMTGKLVWGRDCAAVLPDMDTLRKAVAE